MHMQNKILQIKLEILIAEKTSAKKLTMPENLN